MHMRVFSREGWWKWFTVPNLSSAGSREGSLELTFGFCRLFFLFFLSLAFKLAGLLLWYLKLKGGKKKKKKTGLGFIDPTDASGTKLIPDAAPLSIVLHEGSIPFIVLCGLYSIIS